jgi:V-type H+-transporting ATPase subunit E
MSETRNNSNLNRMRKRNELMEKLVHETSNKIVEFAKPDNQRYRELVRQLILQGMVKMLEPICFVRVRKCDVDFVKKMFRDLETEFTNLMKKETEEEYRCTLEIDETVYLDCQA